MTAEPKHRAALKEREQSILRHVVYNYIQTAIPVGSRYIAKHFEPGLSPASIRNVMADLEDSGFLSHPHTSAGRVPTDVGYRFYIDFLMDAEELDEKDKKQIRQQLDQVSDTDELLRETSRLLGRISHQLSIVTSPHLGSGIFEKIELIPVSASKLLSVISIRAGIVRTIMLEIGAEIKRDRLDHVGRLLNERLSGLTLKEIRETFPDRVKDVRDEKTGLIRLFVESVDQLFTDTKDREKVHVGGTKGLIEQPEFIDPRNFRSVIELIDNEDIIVHLLEKHDEMEQGFVVTVGKENKEESTKEYSVVTTRYDVNEVTGRIGIIGPKRMDYAKVIPLVDFVAQTVAKMMSAA